MADVDRGIDRLAQHRGIGDPLGAAFGNHGIGGLFKHIARSAHRLQQGDHRPRLPDRDRRGRQLRGDLAVHFLERGREMAEDEAFGADLGQGRGVGRDHVIADLAHAFEMQVGVRLGAEHHGEVEDARQKIGAHLVGIVRLDVEGRIRQSAAKARDPTAEVEGGKVVLDAKPHQMRAALGDLDAASGLVPFMAQGAGMGFEPLALGGEVGAGARAVEKAAAHGLFQCGDPCRNGGLGEAQLFGGAVKAAGLGQVEEGVEEFDLHAAPCGPRRGFTPRTPVGYFRQSEGVIGFLDQ
ncbi:hypothetical protein MASR1M32_24630 [Rhodobacter sp.]